MQNALSRLTREDILRAAKTFVDFRPAKWTVLIGGIEFPARPIVRDAAGMNPMDASNSHQSVSRLRTLGFEVRYKGKAQAGPPSLTDQDEKRARALAAVEDMRALRNELKLGPFDMEQFKNDRDEGRP